MGNFIQDCNHMLIPYILEFQTKTCLGYTVMGDSLKPLQPGLGQARHSLVFTAKMNFSDCEALINWCV